MAKPILPILFCAAQSIANILINDERMFTFVDNHNRKNRLFVQADLVQTGGVVDPPSLRSAAGLTAHLAVFKNEPWQ